MAQQKMKIKDSDDENRSMKDRFKQFFETYTKEGRKIYLNEIKDLVDTKDKDSLVIDCGDLSAETNLSNQVIENPLLSKNGAEEAINEIISERRDENKDIVARFKNLPMEKIQVREIGSENINQMVEVEGLLTRASDVKPFAKRITFKCSECGNEMNRDQKPWAKMKKPPKCDRMDCGAPKSKIYIKNEDTKFENWQSVKIQERPENLSGGQTPRYINGVLKRDIVDIAPPGTRVTVTGIVKATPPVGRDKKPVFGKIIEVNYIEPLEKEVEEIEIDETEEERIKELASDPNVMNKIRKSIAPAIRGHDNLKEALGLVLFGGSKMDLPDGTVLRGNSNILLIGDPGTGKSVILKYIENIAPRGMYTSGKSSTGAGLTAAAVKDELTGSWALEAGALVLSDGGVCAIDEFDKMSNKDRSSIHEAMEQGTVSVAKAGITATLNARTSIIAGANPKHGRFDKYKPVADQVNLSPTILSRFDLIFKIVDEPDEEKDSKIAEHVLGIRKDISKVEPPIEPEMMKKYVAFARRQVNPKMTKESMEKIKDYYLQMRQTGNESEDSPIPITARQLESLIRLAESHARMRLSEKVEQEDAAETVRLMDKVLKDMGLDPASGELDVDSWMTGEPKSQRDKIELLEDIIKEISKDKEEGAPMKTILKKSDEANIEKNTARNLIEKMKENGDIIEKRPGVYQSL